MPLAETMFGFWNNIPELLLWAIIATILLWLNIRDDLKGDLDRVQSSVQNVTQNLTALATVYTMVP